MTRHATTGDRGDCAAARRSLLAGTDEGPDAAAHLAACAHCASFAARLGRIDAALDAGAADAATTPIPAALRARILAAAAGGTRAAAPSRGRVLDLLLRAAAVAAVLVAAAWISPEAVFAGDIDLASLAPPDLGIDDAIAARVGRLPELGQAAPLEIPGGPGPLAAAAAVLFVGGWLASRAGRPS